MCRGECRGVWAYWTLPPTSERPSWKGEEHPEEGTSRGCEGQIGFGWEGEERGAGRMGGQRMWAEPFGSWRRLIWLEQRLLWGLR